MCAMQRVWALGAHAAACGTDGATCPAPALAKARRRVGARVGLDAVPRQQPKRQFAAASGPADGRGSASATRMAAPHAAQALVSRLPASGGDGRPTAFRGKGSARRAGSRRQLLPLAAAPGDDAGGSGIKEKRSFTSRESTERGRSVKGPGFRGGAPLRAAACAIGGPSRGTAACQPRFGPFIHARLSVAPHSGARPSHLGGSPAPLPAQAARARFASSAPAAMAWRTWGRRFRTRATRSSLGPKSGRAATHRCASCPWAAWAKSA